MEWLGGIAQLIGALGVVVSLYYVAMQIKSQIRESRVAAMQEVSAAFRDVVGSLGSLEVSALLVKGNKDSSAPESLDETELFRAFVIYQRIFKLWEEAYYLNSEDRLENRIWEGVNSQFTAWKSSPLMDYVWGHRKVFYGQDFVKHVDSLETIDYKMR